MRKTVLFFPRQRTARWAGFFGAIVVIGLLLAGCQPSADPDSLYPLDTGLQWTYRITTEHTGAQPATTHRSVKIIGTTTLAGGREATIRRYDDGQRYYETRRSDGFYRLAYQPLLADAPEPDRPAIAILPLPARKGRRWKAPTHTYLLERARVFVAPNTADHTIRLDYRITDTDATVRVPAGHFARCVVAVGRFSFHLDRSTGFNSADVPIVQKEWFCPGVGLVKITRDEKITSQQRTITGGHIKVVLNAYSD